MPRFCLLLVVALVPQVGNLVGIRILGMFFVAIAVIGIWCAYNRDIPGTAVVGVGIGLNLLVMGFHGGAMPIRADVLAAFGQVAAPGTILVGSKDVVIDTSALWLLSDLGRSTTGEVIHVDAGFHIMGFSEDDGGEG